jgi:transcriptional regulator with XRE-family HTH domain
LRLRRLSLGLTQADLAEVAGISREQVVRLEAGTCEPTWRTALALAHALEAEPLTVFPQEKAPAGTPGLLDTATAGQGRHGRS